MSEDKIESAVQRIEAALARIADIADHGAPPSDVQAEQQSTAEAPSVIALVEKHEALRETVSNTLEELDELIGELEQ